MIDQMSKIHEYRKKLRDRETINIILSLLDKFIATFDWDLEDQDFCNACIEVLEQGIGLKYFSIGSKSITIWPKGWIGCGWWFGDYKLSELSKYQSRYSTIHWVFHNGMQGQPARIRIVDNDHPDWECESHVVISFS